MKVNPRILTIKELFQRRNASSDIIVPQILLSGIWLQQAGFDSPASVLISVKHNKLIIERDQGQMIEGNVRRIKISDAYIQRKKGYKRVPKIVLSGLWLKDANFGGGEKIYVDVKADSISIQKDITKSFKIVSIPSYKGKYFRRINTR